MNYRRASAHVNLTASNLVCGVLFDNTLSNTLRGSSDRTRDVTRLTLIPDQQNDACDRKRDVPRLTLIPDQQMRVIERETYLV